MTQIDRETKFKIDESFSLGSGSFGQVFSAQRIADSLNICVKKFAKKQEFGEYVIESFCQHEIDITKTLITNPHQNLVQIYDVFWGDIQDDNAYIFMEVCDGNLSQFTERTKLEIKDQLLEQLILDVTNGYCQLIQLNIIHRDLKPENILYKNQNGKTIFKIADFGLSKIIDNSAYMTKNTGSHNYKAPEVVEKTNYDNKCDIFSFGIILFEIMIGKFANASQPTIEDKKKLENTKFSKIYTQHLGFQQYVELLDKMICYDQNQRISWEHLKIWIENYINKKSMCAPSFKQNQFQNNSFPLFQQNQKPLLQSSIQQQSQQVQGYPINNKFQQINNPQSCVQTLPPRADFQKQCSNNFGNQTVEFKQVNNRPKQPHLPNQFRPQQLQQSSQQQAQSNQLSQQQNIFPINQNSFLNRQNSLQQLQQFTQPLNNQYNQNIHNAGLQTAIQFIQNAQQQQKNQNGQINNEAAFNQNQFFRQNNQRKSTI